MSFDLIAMPLREVPDGEDGWEWFASLPIAGIPAERPTAGHRLTVADAIDALRAIDAHGQCWPAVEGVDPFLLEPDRSLVPEGCDVGTITFQVPERELREAVRPTDVFTVLSFDRPDPRGALAATCALAAKAPLVLFEAGGMEGVTVAQGARIEDLEAHLPW